MKARTVVRSLVLAGLFLAVPAHADFHFMKIVEVFSGTAVAPNAQYIVLQMYVSGQQFVAGHAVTIYNANGTQVASVSFPANVGNGANQAKLLVATQQAEDFFGVSADLTIPAAILAAGGKVCFAGTVDCVAWGGWSGSASGVGTPFNADGGIPPGRAALRRLDIAGSSITLDAGDDTNNCAVDFESGLPQPRNNAGQFGTIPPATCGNDAVEGLEQCDDGNLAGGDGCSSTCQADEALQQPVGQDFDGDGEADVFWRNRSTGRNTIWRSGDAATMLSTVGVSDTKWEVVGIGDFNGDGRADAFWRHRTTGRNTIWLGGDATTQQTTTGVSNRAWEVVAVGDFNGDGNDDAFWRNQATGRNVIWRSGKASTSQSVTGVSNLDWTVVGAGDFDGDGRDDVFWRRLDDGRNTIWLSADAATQQATTRVSNLAWEVVEAGDFNGDGNDDAFWRNRATGRNVVWLSGKASTSQAVTGVSDTNWTVASAGDFDGDGRDDVFWRNQGNGRNAIWLSANAATQQGTARVSNLAWQVVPYEGPGTTETQPEPGPTVSVANATSFEGDSGTTRFNFAVLLSHAADAAVGYSISTRDGTALAGSDYTAQAASGSFAAGETVRSFGVDVRGDTTEEGDETFNVVLAGVSGAGATVGDGLARGTIRDDDSGY